MVPELTPPHDAEAEAGLLGRVLTHAYELPAALNVVAASDFYDPAHVTLWNALGELHATGRGIDTVSLVDQLRSQGEYDRAGGQAKLAELFATFAPSWRSSADVVVKLAQYRRIITLGWEAVNEAKSAGGDPLDLRDSLVASLGDLTTVDDGRPVAGFIDWGTAHDRDTSAAPWLIDDLVRQLHRVMIVAGEGMGKTVLLRTMALCAEAGLHPFTRRPLEAGPIHTLTIDLENPPEQVTDVGRMISRALRSKRIDFPTSADLWERPGGIDIRNRRDRSELERVLARSRPELVVMGPVYKSYLQHRGEPDDQAVRDVIGILDDLRTRYEFGLVLEHHAPHGETHHRAMRPFGSSMWLRWPELGLGIEADDIVNGKKRFKVNRWRGDRIKTSWPDELEWGDTFPFDAVYRNGMPLKDAS